MGDAMKLSDLQLKKVISVSTGRNIGSISDAIINDDGNIDSLLIAQGKGMFSLAKDGDVIIRWSEITKIGEDVILVKTN